MGTTILHIERLEIDLRGITPQVARDASATLGPALAQALAGQAGGDSRLSRPVAEITAPTVRLSDAANVAEVRDAIVRQVTGAIRAAGASTAAGTTPGPAARTTSIS
jgi:hypothetical protein